MSKTKKYRLVVDIELDGKNDEDIETRLKLVEYDIEETVNIFCYVNNITIVKREEKDE